MSKNRAEEFLNTFKKTADFVKELLQENEKLRYQIANLQEELKSYKEKGVGVDAHAQCIAKIAELEAEKNEILNKIREVEAENKSFAEKYVEVEQENNNLANLYIASYQLHSTLNFKEVVQIIMEIVINLIGAEIFVLYLLDEKTNELSPVATEGIEMSEVTNIKLGKGIVGKSAKTGENYFSEIIPMFENFNQDNPIACIPLKIKEHTIGVIAIYKLLIQKCTFNELDYELFTLLAGHAATALFSAKLYTESERKLSTIQGFIELLTK